MPREPEVENAQIESTMLGIEDHGILTFWLYLAYGGAGQGCGGYGVSHGDDLAYCVKQILDVVGVSQWEQLSGKYVRVLHDNSKVYAIGNVIADKWFRIADEMKARFEARQEQEKKGTADGE